MTDDRQKLMEILPPEIRQNLDKHPHRDRLIEVVLDLGRFPEARFLDKAEYLSNQAVTREQLKDCIQRVGSFGADNRAGIEQTLHRISAIRNRAGEIIGLTCRVGRAVFGTIAMIRDLVETGQSILLLGRPGVGKTTALREIARVLADDLNKRVVIIDTSNEIAGDGDIPHPAIGRARRMQVARPELQHQVMIEAVENHMPEVIVIDEIGTELEALAARTIAERGVQLVGTAHGNQLENLIKNPTLSDLVGGIQSVTLGDDEARRRGSQKSVLERKAPPTFDVAIEMLERQRWVVHESVAETVDRLLRGYQPVLQVRTVDEQGKVAVSQETPTSQPTTVVAPPTSTDSRRYRSTGQLLPFPKQLGKDRGLLRESIAPDPLLTISELEAQSPVFRLFPYAMGRQQVKEVIEMLNLPIVLSSSIRGSDAILALRSHARKHTNLQRIAEEHQIPIHLLKANTIPHITHTLQQILGINDDNDEASDEPHDGFEPGYFAQSGDEDDELDALEEARLAVEQIVIPKGQPVELLPRSAKVRKMQHELIERYRLKSDSLGIEPNRRLRIYPA